MSLSHPCAQARLLGALVTSALLLTCSRSGEGEVSLRPPPNLRAALSQFDELGASAQLVPDQGAPHDAVTLDRGQDGTSFSGFIPAEPGAYTLEVVFTGRLPGADAALFLGRWTSDGFTVARGDAATPVFSRPLDTIGRPGDGGDPDGDGLGNLDEVLWGTDLDSADSDGDGVNDGEDCFPDSASQAAVISAQGSIEDCDGDGFRRPDSSAGQPGDDCDDLDATVNPAAVDDCSDGVDQDCNAATCPGSDTVGPSITLLDPADGEIVGCHRRVRVELDDESGVASAEVLFVDGAEPPLVVDRFVLNHISGLLWRTREFNGETTAWMDQGTQRVIVATTDEAGNESELRFSMEFQLSPPAATVSPTLVETPDAPFDITVTATAAAGIASVRLLRAPYAPWRDVQRALEQEVGNTTSSPAVFTVDPRTLPDGNFVFYPVVEDLVGNRLEPDQEFLAEAGASGALEVEPDWWCTFEAGVMLPMTLVTVGAPSLQPATMHDLYLQARSEAETRDPVAELVEIRGYGLEPDGTVRLDQLTSGSGEWWQFTFFNFTDNREIEVTWYPLGDDVVNPEVLVEEDSPFGFSYTPIAEPDLLVNSDAAAAAYAATAGSCPALTGAESDVIRYESDEPFNSFDVIRIEVGEITWKATALSPITELWPCE